METVLLTDLKCDTLTGRINWWLSHILFFALLPPFAFLSPFIHHFYLLLFRNMFISSLHNLKSKISKNKNKYKELWKRMEGICFAFDAFGQ
jgi:hypothetical protein